jgi:hypothetical protein
VLFRRRSGSLIRGALPRPPVRERVTVSPWSRRERPSIERVPLRERLAPLLPALRATAIGLGRLPEPEEVPADDPAAVLAERVSVQRALELLREDLAGDREFKQAAQVRRQDLLVHLALSQVPGAPKYKTLPRSLQTDIRTFFRSHALGLEE